MILASLVLIATTIGAARADDGQPGRDLIHGLALLANQQAVTADELFSDLGTLVRAQGKFDLCHPEFGLDGVPPVNVTASIVSAIRSPGCKGAGLISLLSLAVETRPGLSLEPVSKCAATSQLAWVSEHRSGAHSSCVSTEAQESRAKWPLQ